MNEKLLKQVFLLRKNDFKNEIEFFKAFEESEDERKKSFDILVTKGFLGTEKQFLDSAGVGKTNGVVAMDATVTPEKKQASESTVSEQESISSELPKPLDLPDNIKRKLSRENLTFEERVSLAETNSQRELDAEDFARINMESTQWVEKEESKKRKIKNPLYSGKDSGVSQFVEEVIPNQDWLRTKDQAIKNILENDENIGEDVDYKYIEDNPQFDFKVKDEMIKIHSKQLEANVIDEKTEAIVENLEDKETFSKKTKDLAINIGKFQYGGDFVGQTEKQIEIERIDKKLLDNLNTAQGEAIRYLDNSQKIRNNISKREQEIMNTNYTSQGEVDKANTELKNLRKTSEDIFSTQKSRYDELNTILEDSNNAAVNLDAIERNYNLLPIYATELKLSITGMGTQAVELANSAIDVLSTPLIGSDYVTTPLTNMSLGLMIANAKKNEAMDDFREASTSIKEQIRSGIAKPKQLKDLKDGDDWGRYFATLLGSQTINTAILFSTGGYALPILAAQATGGSFEQMAEDERQSRINYETWLNSDEDKRGEVPELLQYTPLQRYATGIGNGALEYFSEKISLGIINRAKKAAIGLPDLRKGFAKGIKDIVNRTTTKGLAKNSLLFAYDGASEAGAEAFVELGSNMFDRNVLGKDVNLFDGVADAAFSGFIMANGVYKAPSLFNSISQLVQGKDSNQKIAEARIRMIEIGKILQSNQNSTMSPENRRILEQEHKRLMQESSDEINKTLNRFGRMSRKEINRLGKIELETYKLRKQAQQIRDDKGLLEGKEDLLKSLKEKKQALEIERLKILAPYEIEEIKKQRKENPENFKNRVALNLRKIESEIEVIEDFIGEDNVVVFDTTEEFVKETGSPKNADGYYNPDDDKIYINKQRAAEVNAITVGSHELLHRIMRNTFSDETKGTALVNRFIDVLKEKNPEAYAKIQAKIDRNYRFELDEKGDFKLNKEGNKIEKDFSEYAEEYFTQFNDVAYTPSLGESLVNFGKDILEFLSLKQIGFTNADFTDSSGKDVYDFLTDYKRKFKKGKVSKKAKALAKESQEAEKAFDNIVSENKKSITNVYTELQKIDEFEADFMPTQRSKRRKKELLKIVQDENAYEELRQIDEFEANFNPTEFSKNRKKELLDLINKEEEKEIKKFSKNEKASAEVQRLFNEKPRDWENLVIEQMRPITAKLVERRRDVTGFNREELLRDFEVGERGVFDLIRSYDPSKNDSLAAYINTFLSFRAQESSKRILKPVFESDVTEEKGVAAQEDDLSIEDAIDESFKPTVEEKSKLRRQIKLPDEQVEKVRQAVRKTFGTRLPPLKSPEFKKALRKAYDTELFKDLKTNVFKTRDEYRNFLRENWKALYDAIPQETLNQSFATFREPVLDKNGKQKREKTPEGERIFRKKNINREEFLDYFFNTNIGGSTRGTRKDAIVRMLAQELGFDATMETIQEPKVAEKIEFVNPSVDVVNTAEIINRFPNKLFSLNNNLSYEDIIKEVKEKTKSFYSSPGDEKQLAKSNATIKLRVIENLIPVLKDKLSNDVKYLLIYSLTGTGKLSDEAIKRIKKETGLTKKEIKILGATAMLYANVKGAEKALELDRDAIKEEKKSYKNLDEKSYLDQAFEFIGLKLSSTGKITDKNLNRLFKNEDLQQLVVKENNAKKQAFEKIIKALADIVVENESLLPEVLHLISLQAYYQGHFIRKLMPFVSFTKPYGENFETHDEHFSKAVDTSIYAQYMIMQAAKNRQKYIKSVDKNGETQFTKDFNKLWSGSGRGVVTKASGNKFDLNKKPGQTEDINTSPFINVKEKLKKDEKKQHFLLPNTSFNKTDKLVNILEINEDGFYEAEITKEKDNKLDQEINDILENKTSIAASETISEARARIAGAKKRIPKFFIPSSADDFVGLIYYMLGKGKKGEEQMKWFQTNLFDPYAKAEAKVSSERIKVGKTYNNLLKEFDIIPTTLKKEIPGEPFTQEQAIRVYIWDLTKQTIPGLSESEQKTLVDYVNSNKKLKRFAEKVMKVSFGYGYAKPGSAWTSGNISTDFLEVINTTKRSAFLQQWQKNVDVIFSKDNLNKMQAAFGTNYRIAVENALGRMKTGRNAQYNADSNTARFMDWVNGSIGTIMFFNDKSATLQLLSTINFINWSDNNILKAGKAFANQPQYWSDFKMLFNSDFLLNRRDGLKMNVNEADLADAAKTSGARGVISKILKVGFLPTKLADSFAIASGGASFYRNRVNSLIKNGVSEKDAKERAFRDFREIAEETQQSSRPDKISQQQASPIGRTILNFVNTNMQYNRVAKKAALDLINRRGDTKTNISKIVYYMAVQNLIFNALQQGLFAVLFGDIDEDEKKKQKYFRVANGMADSFLRGLGITGGIFSVVKNAAIKVYEEQEKNNPKYEKVALEALKISPPISSKMQRLFSAARTFTYDKKEIKQKGLSITSPAVLGVSQVVSAVTNLPADRVIKKVSNVAAATTEDLIFYQRIALLFGWSKWDLGIEDYKKKNKNKKKTIRSTKTRNTKIRKVKTRTIK